MIKCEVLEDFFQSGRKFVDKFTLCNLSTHTHNVTSTVIHTVWFVWNRCSVCESKNLWLFTKKIFLLFFWYIRYIEVVYSEFHNTRTLCKCRILDRSQPRHTHADSYIVSYIIVCNYIEGQIRVDSYLIGFFY